MRGGRHVSSASYCDRSAPTTDLAPYPCDLWDREAIVRSGCGLFSKYTLGKIGAVALLVTLFMAVPSYATAELIAVPSILILGVEKMYFKPIVTSENLIFVAQLNVAVFGLSMAISIIVGMCLVSI